MASIQLSDLEKSYDEVTVVKKIDLHIKSGEFLVLLGPSGCGKSTTLRMIAGLEDISSGTIKIGDRIVNDLEPKERDIAMVFQSYALYPHLNVYKNIAFGMRLQRIDKKIIDEKVMKVAEMLELTPLLERKPKDLSGGQRQRVAMGRAMVRTPEVFLFDEPLSNLDAKLRGSMRAEIRQLHQKLGKTTVYVTHDQVEAMTLADRIVILNQGKIAQLGTPREVFLKPANKFVAGFIGSPSMNFFKCDIDRQEEMGDAIEFFGKRIKLTSQFDGGSISEVELGIRPSDIYLSLDKDLTQSNFVKVSATVRVVELLGSTALVCLEVENQEFRVEISANEQVFVGDILNMYMDLNHLHLFDVDSGEVVTR